MTPYNTYLDAIKSALQPDARLPPPYPKFQSSGWVVGFGRRRRVPAPVALNYSGRSGHIFYSGSGDTVVMTITYPRYSGSGDTVVMTITYPRAKSGVGVTTASGAWVRAFGVLLQYDPTIAPREKAGPSCRI
jgi:hypothetical protein